jgi:hypothetical protein
VPTERCRVGGGGAVIELEHAFDYRARLKPPVTVRGGPFGTRVFYEIAGGEVRGPLLEGTIRSGGGDWALVGPDGWTRFDVRAVIEADDGAIVYASYGGVLEPRGRATTEGQYFYSTPTFEAGDERHRALTQSVFVARGRLCDDGVEYDVYRAV